LTANPQPLSGGLRIARLFSGSPPAGRRQALTTEALGNSLSVFRLCKAEHYEVIVIAAQGVTLRKVRPSPKQDELGERPAQNGACVVRQLTGPRQSARAGGLESPLSVILTAVGRWSLPLGRAAAYQHSVPSWPGALRVHVGHPPRWFCSTAEAEGKQEDSCPLAVESCFPFSDDVCRNLASVGFVFKRIIGSGDAPFARLSATMPPV
jgi:hypothetical protein